MASIDQSNSTRVSSNIHHLVLSKMAQRR